MSATATTSLTRPSRARTGHAGLVHLPGLDGLRGIAVLAVLVYHADVGVLPGGFLGVDLFFVLSGFLITGLLLSEERGSGGIHLGGFWARRFRRLLPAVLVFLLAVAAVSYLWADPTSLGRIRSDSLAGLTYVANWWFVVSGQSYAGAFAAPSPVTHLWSLSVEEQYYLMWPLVVAACLGGYLSLRRRSAGRGDGRRALLVVSSAALVASTAWMAVLSLAGASADRLYFGTDTRAATILAGVVLALLLEPHLAARAAGGDTPLVRRGATGAAAAGAVGAVLLAYGAATSDHRDRWLHRGGFTLMAVAAAAVIAAVVLHPRIDRGLGNRPLRWFGTRSYGLYLWHWLVLVVLVWQFPTFTGWPRLVVMLAVTAGIAEVSYRVVERPIRAGRIRVPFPAVTVPAAFVVVGFALVAATTGQQPEPEYLRARDPAGVSVVEPSSTTAAPGTGPVAPTPPTAAATPPAPSVPSAPSGPAPARPTRVLLVGDSVAASLGDALGADLGAAGVGWADSAFPGCGVLSGDPADPEGRPIEITAACGAAIPRTQSAVVRRIHPDLVVVLSTWEVRDRIVDGTWFPYASPDADRVTLDLYRRMTDRLTATGARVALVTVADPVDSRLGPVDPDMLRRHRHLNDLLAEVARRDPARVTLVRMDDIVCPADPCPTEVGGVELRPRDGTHFDEPAAARLVAGGLVPRLLGVPAGTR